MVEPTGLQGSDTYYVGSNTYTGKKVKKKNVLYIFLPLELYFALTGSRARELRMTPGANCP